MGLKRGVRTGRYKICMVVPDFYPHVGGVETLTMETAKALTQKGNEVFVIVPRLRQEYKKKEIVGGIRVYRTETVFAKTGPAWSAAKLLLKTTAFLSGYALSAFVGKNSRFAKAVAPLAARLFQPGAISEMEAIIASEKPDLIHAFDPKVSIVAFELGRHTGLPVVMTFTGITWNLKIPILETPFFTLKAAGSVMGFEKMCYLLPFAAHTTHDDGTGARTVGKTYGRDVTAFYTIVDSELFNPLKQSGAGVRKHLGLKPETRVFANVSRLTEHKGIAKEIAAYAGIASLKEKAMLLIGWVYDKRYFKYLEALVKEKEAENVFFLTEVKHDKLPEHIAAADIVVFNAAHSNLNVSLAETMMMGKTCVVGRRGEGIEETLGGAAYFFNPDSISDLRQKMELAMREPRPAAAVRKKALELFGADRNSEILLGVYQKVLEAKK